LFKPLSSFLSPLSGGENHSMSAASISPGAKHHHIEARQSEHFQLRLIETVGDVNAIAF
jgi:hypothetical protein